MHAGPQRTASTDSLPAAPSKRRIGIAAGGGGYGLKGIYVLASDGLLHEQVVTTGIDYAPAIKFLPSAASPSGLNIVGKTIYASTSAACGVPGGVWAINMTSADYPVAHYDIPKGSDPASMETTLAPDGTAYVLTRGRTFESIIRLSCQQRGGSGKQVEGEGLVHRAGILGCDEPHRVLLQRQAACSSGRQG